MVRLHSSFVPAIIDIEASGFGAQSYPIEVGLADRHASSYCRLVRPEPDWKHWTEEAENTHKVSRSTLLDHGVPAITVASELNRRLAGRTVYSDGWVVDKPWLIKLFHAAGIQMKFSISPLELILSESQMQAWTDIRDMVIMELGVSRHRASIDAKIIQQTYIRSRNL